MAIRRRLLVSLATTVLFAGGVALAASRGHGQRAVGSIGVNRLHLRPAQTTYRLTLDGRASIGGGAPASPGIVAPGGRYRLDSGSPGVAVTDTRTGRRRVLTRDPYTGRAYWGPQGTLAFTDRHDGLTRLLTFDPVTGARRVVASHLCGDDVVDPWSPDGRALAIPVSPPSGGCNGHGGSEAAVASPGGGGVRRIATLGTMPVTWSRDSSRILVADPVRQVLQLVDPRSGRGRVVLPSLVLPLEGTWSPGRRFYAADNDRTVWILDGSLARVVHVFGSVLQYAWSPNGRWLAIAEADGIRVVAVDSGRAVARIPARTPRGLLVESLAWEPSGRALVVSAGPERAPLGHD